MWLLEYNAPPPPLSKGNFFLSPYVSHGLRLLQVEVSGARGEAISSQHSQQLGKKCTGLVKGSGRGAIHIGKGLFSYHSRNPRLKGAQQSGYLGKQKPFVSSKSGFQRPIPVSRCLLLSALHPACCLLSPFSLRVYSLAVRIVSGHFPQNNLRGPHRHL